MMVLEKLQNSIIKTKKQELESQINAICKEKILKISILTRFNREHRKLPT